MLNFRLVGGIMVATGALWWGMCEARKLKTRVEFLKAVSSGLERAAAEIEFGKYEIAYIFQGLNINNDKGLFKICSKNIKSMGIKNAWEKAVEVVNENGFLKEDDKSVIIQLGNSLGMSDVKGQKNNINMVVSELMKSILRAEDENERLGKVYRGCGALLGVFILIILI